MTTRINIIVLGIEKIGSSLINQIIASQDELLYTENLELRIPVITNSTVAFFEKPNKKNAWEANFAKCPIPFSADDILYYLAENELENTIIIDTENTPEMFPEYFNYIQNNSSIISINQSIKAQANDFSIALKSNKKKFSESVFFLNNSNNESQTVKAIFQKIVQTAKTQYLKIAI